VITIFCNVCQLEASNKTRQTFCEKI
jgi:hypothetical protein